MIEGLCGQGTGLIEVVEAGTAEHRNQRLGAGGVDGLEGAVLAWAGRAADQQFTENGHAVLT
ncbi:hypothetical protein D3C85_1643540 [compost metagenome]